MLSPRADAPLAARVLLLASAGIVAAWMVLLPRTADLAAQVYRVGPFERAGWILWDNNWFGGHNLPGYSLLTPWLMSHAGVGLTGAVAAVTTTVALLGMLSAAASPVAGLFLAMVVGVWWTVRRRHALVAVAASATLVTVVCGLLFGDGGSQPYPVAAAGVAVLIALLLRRGLSREALLGRRALLGYVVVVAASCLLPTPMGSNIARLGVAFAVPVALLARRRAASVSRAAGCVAAAAWMVFAPATEVAKSVDAPATHASYYAPLLAQLALRDTTPGRIEVVPSATRWESVYVGARYPLARGWETQIDRARNALFYARGLSAASYLRWLQRNAVAFVALSRGPKERWGRAEERLLRRGVRGLRLVWAASNWRLYAVVRPAPLADGARVTDLGVDRVAMRFATAQTARLRVRWSPYWDGGPGVCIAKRPDGFIDVSAARAGPVVLRISPLAAAEGTRGC
jgi:hypothetical protein